MHKNIYENKYASIKTVPTLILKSRETDMIKVQIYGANSETNE